MRTLSTKLAEEFQKNDYKWAFSTGLKIPTAEDIDKTLDVMREHLLESEEDTQIELGRLIMRKREGHYDVFMYMGETDGNND